MVKERKTNKDLRVEKHETRETHKIESEIRRKLISSTLNQTQFLTWYYF